MQEPIDDETPEIVQYSVMHYLMVHPKAPVDITELDEDYQEWLRECHLEAEADRQLSLNKDAGEEEW